MRFLIYSEGKKDDFKELISFLEKDRLIIVDFFNDMEEAEYCAEIRKYDTCLIESKTNMVKYVNFLKNIKVYNEESKNIYFGDSKDQKIIDYYTKGSQYIQNKQDMFEELYETISAEIHYKNIIINTKNEKKIWIIEDGKRKEIEIYTKIDFFLLTYFLRHYDEKINVGRLIDAISKEPELTKSSIAETSISSIRKLFKEELNINPIKAFKKVGYRFAY